MSGKLQDYGDTAVVVAGLDLVITVDTSVAHLAGALGKPVWTLLCYNPDWRWGVEGADSTYDWGSKSQKVRTSINISRRESHLSLIKNFFNPTP